MPAWPGRTRKCGGPPACSTTCKKKFKDKTFAAGVNREVIRKGCEMLGVPLDEIIRETIEGMKEHAGEIGLAGGAEA